MRGAMLRQDSIPVHSLSSVSMEDTVAYRPMRPQTPYQVLQMLPADATPAQQDSAIQAWFQPGEIHYSEQPDTLHLPGHGVGRNLKEVDIPQYYRENFFSADTLYHEELDGGRYGVAGDPIPYSVRNDHVLTSLLILCFLLITFSFSRNAGFITRQVKDFFYIRKGEHTLTETGNEVWFQLLLAVITCLQYSLLYYFYVTHYVADTFILSSEYQLLGIFMAVFVGYNLFKWGLYTLVNNVFFDGKRNLQFMKSFLFITAGEGVFLFPVVLLLAYFEFEPYDALYYCIFILVSAKLLTFYKAWVIFFKQKGLYLHIILYLCALEMIPLPVLWSGLSAIVNFLEINF